MLTPRRRPLALACLCTVLFLTFLDNTVVSVALASIQSDLHGGVSALQWVVGAYALTFASLMLAFGMLAGRAGAQAPTVNTDVPALPGTSFVSPKCRATLRLSFAS